MFLRSLLIENVRSIEHLELDFTAETNKTRKWTILLGENGTGKSTVLRSAALLLGGSNVLPALMPEPAVWVRNGARRARIVARIVTARQEVREVKLEIERGQGVAQTVKANHQNLEPLDAALQYGRRNYFVAGYGASRRLANTDVATFATTEGDPRAQAVASMFSRDAALRSLDAWAMDLDYRRSEAGVEMIRSALGELLPDVSFARIDREKRELLFSTPDGEVSLQQLSDGYQNMAAWTGDLLFRITETFQNYRDPLSARGLLLLDEIDLHLHPRWQRRLLLYLDSKLPNFQILATTHSPFTAQQASPGALHVISRNAPAASGSKSVLSAWQYAGDPKLLRVEQLLEPLLGLSTSESLAAQRVREKQRKLKRKSARTAGEKRQLRELTEAIRVLPEAQAIEPAEKARLDLLDRIEAHLSGARVPRTRGAASQQAVASDEIRPSAAVLETVFAKMNLQPGGPKSAPAKKKATGSGRARSR